MSQIEKIVRAFKTVAQNSSPVAATVLNISSSEVSVASSWSQRNLERRVTVQLQLLQAVDLHSRAVRSLGAVETTPEIMATYSPSGIYRGLFRETPAAGKTPKKQFLEVWKENRLWRVIDVTALEVHGDVYTDNEFGTFEWSSCEEKILYVAEKKVPKSEPFISVKSPSKKPEESTKGGEYLFVEDWGEALVGKSSPVLAVARVGCEEGEVETLGGPPGEELCLGQGVWAPDGGVVAVAWSPTPRRLGLVYCTNRTSWIFHISPKGEYRKLSGEGMAVRSPQFSPDGRALVWLERPSGGPHHACHRLVKYDWIAQTYSTVLDIVQEETKCTGGEPFYGLYNLSLKHCWMPDSKTLILSTPQKSSVKTFLVDSDSKSISEVRVEGNDGGSCGLITCSKEGLVVCWRSSLTTAPGLYLAASLEPDSPVDWIPLIESKPLLFAKDYQVQIIDLEALEESKDPSLQDTPEVRNFCALYLGPKAGREVPLVVWPHGGPHSCFSNSFSIMAALFASVGFGMVMVNYRGSSGSGEAGVKFLPGRVGKTDVADMQQAATHVLAAHPQLAKNKTLLFGGSHGGFLVLHLSSRYPSFYKSVAARNPVTDISPLYTLSDIPDWAMFESGFVWDPKLRPTREMFEKMREVSPLSYVADVQAPTLLLLGKKDLRVPAYQGLAYYHALKARNIKTKVLLYEDNHPILQTMHEADFAINTILWYLDSIDHEIDWLSSDGD